ncbi:MAG: hypothetical protein ACK5FE_13015 [Cyanobacteriota bacterium]|jgi:hypothetical protein
MPCAPTRLPANLHRPRGSRRGFGLVLRQGQARPGRACNEAGRAASLQKAALRRSRLREAALTVVATALLGSVAWGAPQVLRDDPRVTLGALGAQAAQLVPGLAPAGSSGETPVLIDCP